MLQKPGQALASRGHLAYIFNSILCLLIFVILLLDLHLCQSNPGTRQNLRRVCFQVCCSCGQTNESGKWHGLVFYTGTAYQRKSCGKSNFLFKTVSAEQPSSKGKNKDTKKTRSMLTVQLRRTYRNFSPQADPVREK